MRYNLAYIGHWLARHQKLIRYTQWAIILIYACLISDSRFFAASR